MERWTSLTNQGAEVRGCWNMRARAAQLLTGETQTINILHNGRRRRSSAFSSDAVEIRRVLLRPLRIAWICFIRYKIMKFCFVSSHSRSSPLLLYISDYLIITLPLIVVGVLAAVLACLHCHFFFLWGNMHELRESINLKA